MSAIAKIEIIDLVGRDTRHTGCILRVISCFKVVEIFFNSRENAEAVKRIMEADYNELGTADSKEEVVHCKDCKHLMFSDCYGECSQAHMGIVDPNDYCSRGERKLKK